MPIDALKAIHSSRTKILVFMNQKGGVAKTTTTVALADYFARNGRKVLVVDLDYQGSATATLVRASKLAFPNAKPLSDLLLRPNTRFMDSAIGLAEPLQKVSLLPGDESLNKIELRAQLEWLLAVTPSRDARTAMAEAFASSYFLAHNFDLVLIDTPPRFTLGTINALVCATHFVVPTILDNLSIGNVGVLLGLIKTQIKQNLNPQLELAGILPTMTATRDLNNVELAALQQVGQQAKDQWRHDAYVFEAFVPDRVGFGRVAGTRLPMGEDADFFAAVGDEVLKRIGASDVATTKK